ALGPEAVADLATAVRLGEQAVAKQPTWANLGTLGAVMYRAGRIEKAIARLKEAIQKRPGKRSSWAAWLFLAMAHQRLGRAKGAKACLTKANELIGEIKAHRWTDRLEIEILRCEAETLIKGKSSPRSK